jgi:hypothetical protein
MAKLILDQHSYPEKLSEYWHRFGMIQPTTQQLQNFNKYSITIALDMAPTVTVCVYYERNRGND